MKLVSTKSEQTGARCFLDELHQICARVSSDKQGHSECVCYFSFQTRQPVFVQLLQAVFRVYHCNWLIPVQKGSVENCIKVLSDVGKINSYISDYTQSAFRTLLPFDPLVYSHKKKNCLLSTKSSQVQRFKLNLHVKILILPKWDFKKESLSLCPY